jgi:hypothetical protein
LLETACSMGRNCSKVTLVSSLSLDSLPCKTEVNLMYSLRKLKVPQQLKTSQLQNILANTFLLCIKTTTVVSLLRGVSWSIGSFLGQYVLVPLSGGTFCSMTLCRCTVRTLSTVHCGAQCM